MKQIHSYYVSNATVKVKHEENSRPISITHITDFDKHFPGIDVVVVVVVSFIHKKN